MSRELFFYPAIKKDNIFYPILHYKNVPLSIMDRSQSFVDLSYFTEELPMVPREELSDEFKNLCFEIEPNSDNPTYIYKLSDNKIYSLGESRGLVTGYVPIDDLIGYYSSIDGYERQEYFTYNMETPISSEAYAEMSPDSQAKYGKFSHIDTYSKEYICSYISEFLSNIEYDVLEEEGGRLDLELCCLVDFSF